ncbi:hypothetical protein [Granulicella aggregans]|uniref:hypothetical protein n=1 Tax=Granulicella aggregans TaxID=474949 RepID=UPI001616F159|nr:hypothetical protein [Granulicella aggregans]
MRRVVAARWPELRLLMSDFSSKRMLLSQRERELGPSSRAKVQKDGISFRLIGLEGVVISQQKVFEL